jgi:adenylylsulfate kinase
MIVLIMGLPGSGKTTLAIELKKITEQLGYTVSWYNSDMIREIYDDWDFSEQGRMREAMRMRDLCLSKMMERSTDLILCDFVAPTNVAQTIIHADRLIWMDTIKKSRYSDTNKIFEQPRRYDFRVRKKNAKLWAQIILDNIMGNSSDTIKIC